MKISKSAFAETDMYPPVKKFFESLGYDVKSEVKGCDVAMIKNEQLVIIELKKSFNLTLLYQAIDRRKMTTQVYMAIPRPKKSRSSAYADMLTLCRALGLGLMTIAMDSPVRHVEILVFPPAVDNVKNPLRKEILIKEMNGRTKDANIGGSTRRKLMTAYREKCIKIACALEKEKSATAPQLIKNCQTDAATYRIIKFNSYGWFELVGKAEFALSNEGLKMLTDGGYADFVEHYRKEILNTGRLNTNKE